MLSKSLTAVGPVSTLEVVDMNLPPNKSSKTIITPPISEIANLNNTKKKQPRPSSSFTSPYPPTHQGSPTIVSGTKQPQCLGGGNDAESSETPDQPSEAIEANAAATTEADDHCNEHKSSNSMDQGISSRKRRKLNAATSAAAAPDISLRNLIPPRDCPNIRRMLQTAGMQQQLDVSNDHVTQHNESHLDQSSTLQRPTFQFDWSAVIARARSHPQEATEPYFGPVDESSFTTTTIHAANAKHSASSNDKGCASSSSIQHHPHPASCTMKNNILTYKPLHAMLKYDPPLDAVEAILRAHPEAALDVTFEGSALKIAAESGVSSMLVLRLLLVAEMAMRKRLLQQQQDVSAQTKSANDSGEAELKAQTRLDATSHAKSSSTANPGVVDPLLAQQSNMFSAGHNPIRWITEHRIPVKTAAMLLKWYPMGAFQRPSEDGAPVIYDGMAEAGLFTLQDLEALESPLIEIVDDFARDHYDESASGDDEGNDDEGVYDYDSETDYDHVQEPNSFSEQPQQQQQTLLSSSSQTYQQRECLRKERRWEKFLHILYATDLALQSTRRRLRPLSNTEESNDHTAMPVASASRDDSNVNKESHTASSSSAAADAAPSSKINDSTPANSKAASPPPPPPISSIITPFRPVHAWIRCLTSPHLGLEHCRPYGVWSVLCVMGQRIPSEFTVRDTSDGNRTAFQTLAESSARDCRLCLEEVKDVVECLMDADYRSAFLPRSSDGRLIGHVALENGWPCKDLFSRKTSATCA